MRNLSVESTKNPVKQRIRFGDKLLDLSRPAVMGIVNITPDSFYSGSRSMLESTVLERVKDMLMSGAAIIDLGAYSSRPGADDVPEQEELDRILPVVRSVRREFPDAILSIDTFRSAVAHAGLLEGADMINDISGFSVDPKLPEVAAAHDAPYVLMHMRGTPATMQQLTEYDNLVEDILSWFRQKLSELERSGVRQVIVDPGFGFSKTIAQNYALLQKLEAFKEFQLPVLLGISRKSMIYRKLGISPEEALEGTIALNAIGLSKGASILRVHDVRAAHDLIRLLF